MDLRQLEILQAIAETGIVHGLRPEAPRVAVGDQPADRSCSKRSWANRCSSASAGKVRMTPAAESLVQLGQRVFQDVRDTVGAITDRTRSLRGTLGSPAA